jgi:hypothetical protein
MPSTDQSGMTESLRTAATTPFVPPQLEVA